MKKVFTLIIMFFIGILTLTASGQPSLENQNLGQEVVGGTKGEVEGNNISPKPDIKYESHKVVLYFSDNDLIDTYRIEKEVKAYSQAQLPKAALDTWIKGPEHFDLTGLIHPDTIVEYVQEVDGIAHVSFSNGITKSNLGSGGELMLVEQIAMIMEQFGYQKTQILVEGEVKETLLGSVYVGSPIHAGMPMSYLWVEEMQAGFLLQNVAFRITHPHPYRAVTGRITVKGLARVFEGTIQYELRDQQHNIYDKGFTTASQGAPGWGEFKITIDISDAELSRIAIILYEESAKDGSRLNELIIPLWVMDHHNR